MTKEESRNAVVAAECYSDGEIEISKLGDANAAARRVWGTPSATAAYEASEPVFSNGLAWNVANHAAWAATVFPTRAGELRLQAALLRDIFIYPFRRIPEINRSWLLWNDKIVHKLSEAIYVHRRFEDMPILSDALIDAGCVDEEILAHCREPGPHVRGCWLLDLILGKK
jgi:hypothetical protein